MNGNYRNDLKTNSINNRLGGVMGGEFGGEGDAGATTLWVGSQLSRCRDASGSGVWECGAVGSELVWIFSGLADPQCYVFLGRYLSMLLVPYPCTVDKENETV
ncbi:hypothetical protein J6590_054236 [Homalodisca vitripennis]|nr:hypothetical protein J6590_054236 [Homalodisca vitripennis]